MVSVVSPGDEGTARRRLGLLLVRLHRSSSPVFRRTASWVSDWLRAHWTGGLVDSGRVAMVFSKSIFQTTITPLLRIAATAWPEGLIEENAALFNSRGSSTISRSIVFPSRMQ